MLDSVLDNALEHTSNTHSQGINLGVGCRLKLADIKLFANQRPPVRLSACSPPAIENAFDFLASSINQRIPIYGINTHFGDQVNYLDPQLQNFVEPEAYFDSIKKRQENLIKSHSCGLGDVVDSKIIRVAMVLRAHCLAQGYSGISLGAVQALINMINSDIVPLVRCYGSIGASGDLIPLAMIAACICGENVSVFYQNSKMPASQALKLAGLEKFQPLYRDGLAMINGTSFMTAIASLALNNLLRLYKQMLTTIAMALESMLVIRSAYHPLVHQLKLHAGENFINDYLIDFWQGTQLLTDLDELRTATTEHSSTDFTRPVQDYYSLRAVAQGFGPFDENLSRATIWIENEMNSVNDNPIIDPYEQQIHHSANFMGYYITDACDILKMNIAQASTWIHALLANLVHPRKSHNLPANLVANPGRDNGFRPLQLLAAALAIQNRKYAQVQQAYLLPTEDDNQDVSSLGTHAAFDFSEAVDNLERLVSILLLAAVQALEFRGIEKASKKAQTIYEIIRDHSKTMAECRPMSDELNIIVDLLREEKI